MNKSEKLDQYFTKKNIAEQLFECVKEQIESYTVRFDCWLEPAAGNGSFFHLLPAGKRLGIDIEKIIDDVSEHDFLTWDDFGYLRYCTIGNPPFGKNSNLAIKFFNSCAIVSDLIAFIVPKTFFKESVINKLDQNFHLIKYQDLPDNAFEIEGIDKHVPCTFQIWLRGAPRDKSETIKHHPDLEFLPVDRLNEATIIFQRVGVRAGTFKGPDDPGGKSPPSHYYIKCSSEAAAVLRSIVEWPTKYNTAGNPSISKSDLIKAYIAAKQSR